MKLIIFFATLLCVALLVSSNAGSDEKITDEEIQELINAYKEINNNEGKNAAVS